MATWPGQLPPPTLSGYGGEPAQAFLRTDFEAGAARQRRRFTDAPETLTLTWKFTAIEMATFRAFWRTDLGMGAAWCSMTLDLGEGLTAHSTRFIKPYQYRALPGMNWLVSADVEVRNA